MTAIVGQAAVDIVPSTDSFHRRLAASVLPAADRLGRQVGERMGDAISANLRVAIPQAVVTGGRAAVRVAGQQGDDTAGAFSRSLKRHLEVAFRSMPRLQVGLADVGVDAELARIRSKLESLANKRIGIDVDTGVARAEVDRLERELVRLGEQHPNVRVRADTAAARAALAAFRQEIDDVDRRDVDVRVDVDTAGASAAIVALGIQMVATAAIPFGAVIAAGLGAVVTMAAAAGAGVGAMALVAAPAIADVTNAIQAKAAAEDEAEQATTRGAASSGNAASKALQLAGAQQQLAAAHRNAAQSIASAHRQVTQAERAVADAAAQALEKRRTAAEGVKRAEQSLTDATRTAREAEQSLTQARSDAARQLALLNDQLIDGHLSEQEALLRVEQARRDLAAVTADPTATDLDRRAAQLAYERAAQNAKRRKEDFADLQKEAAAQRKAGVEGSEAVQRATEGVTRAQRGVVDQTAALAKARQAADKAAVDGARSVADAQARVADATRNVANAQASAADSIASAQRSIQSATATTTSTTAAATTQQDAYREALADMTPAARGLFDAIAGPSGLTAAFTAWSRSLQPHVLPLFTRAVDGAKASLPGLTPLVLGASAGVGALFDAASQELKEPFWLDFRDGIAGAAEPAIVGLGKALGNITKGIAGVIAAFLPGMDSIADGASNVTAKFAAWGTNLKGSPEFEGFLAYVRENGPAVGDLIGSVFSSVTSFTAAVAPMAGIAMAVLQPLFDGITWLSTEMPGLIQTLWLLFAASRAITVGMAAFGIAMGLYNTVVALAALETFTWGAALQTTGIVPLITAIVVVIALLVAGVIWAYKNISWFRTAVDTTWNAIRDTVSFVWERILKPAIDGLRIGFQAIGDAAVWLWSVMGPVFGFIADAAQLLVTGLITLLLLPAYLAFQALAAVAVWLWEKALSPAFGWIADGAIWLWDHALKPAFGESKKTFEALGTAGKWLWDKVLQPAFQWIGDKAKWLYDKAIGPALKESKKTFEALGDAGKWLWDKVLQPVFQWIGDKGTWVWEKALSPAFDGIKKGIKAVGDSFEDAKDFIGDAWKEVQDLARKPVKFLIEHVYNKGILPLWNKVASITGADDLKPMDVSKFATGGILPGYSPGVDDRIIAVGGGEAILRPEVTRAFGPDPINTWNAAARRGGVSAVQKAIGNGLPHFANGGIVGDIWGAVKGVGSAVKNTVTDTADLLMDPGKLFGAATTWAKSQMSAFTDSRWGRAAIEIPVRLLKSLKGSLFGDDTGTTATGGVGKALMFAKMQAGKAYQWGGAYNPSFDCSGLMSSIQKVIEGRDPRGRLWSTHSFSGSSAPAGWVRDLQSPFRIGITNAGVGHTAGTLAGVNVESRGGEGVVIGPRARGWNDSLFTHHYGFAPAIKALKGYAAGGYPGVGEYAVVGEQGPELVQFLTPTKVHSNSDSMAIARATNGMSTSAVGQAPNVTNEVRVFVGDQEITNIVRTEVATYSDDVAADLETGRWM
ncbi:hypothetical protein ACFYPK_07490 [Streptomyces halstedii]|uniref:hypothetical protein n=1 Tax=Streptomyces halstedii TaxID=1944 RepID=UPI00367A7D8D